MYYLQNCSTQCSTMRCFWAVRPPLSDSIGLHNLIGLGPLFSFFMKISEINPFFVMHGRTSRALQSCAPSSVASDWVASKRPRGSS